MTVEELRKIEERCERATQGPWGIECGTYGNRITFIDWDYDFPSRKWTAYLRTRDKLSDSWNAWGLDAEFIAHAREDVPNLIAEVRRLREALTFYAEPRNWSFNILLESNDAEEIKDGFYKESVKGGKRAREALRMGKE